MALIDKEFIPPKKEQINIRLDPELLDLLECYCRFIQSAQNYVVEQSLGYTFRRDREFQQRLLKNRTTGEKAKKGRQSEIKQQGGRSAPQDRNIEKER